MKLPLPRQDDPGIGALVPWPALVVAEHGIDREPGGLEPPRHLRHRERAERQLETVDAARAAAPLDVLLIEDRQPATPILADRLDQRQSRRARDVRAGSCAGCTPPSAAGRARDRSRTAPRDRQRARPTRACPADRARASATAAPRRAPSRSRIAVRRRKGSARMSPRTSVHAIGQPGAPQSPACPLQHRLGAIDADESRAGPGDRQRDAAGAAPELQDRSRLCGGEPAPERDVPPRHGLRVLPVVERRVFVPAPSAVANAQASAR